jgi:hypothetical protein
MKDRIPSTNCIFMIDLYTLKQKFCSPVPTSTRHAIIARKLVELIGFLSNLHCDFEREAIKNQERVHLGRYKELRRNRENQPTE